ncbi:MAG: response regulator [candidate division KSB1 bacterium]|nr:response regulator [candidate division KSB1 bacterium]MDQ7065210.1 response regulator [candidate division KSB1 bacterium]
MLTAIMEEDRMSMDRLAHYRTADILPEPPRIIVIEGNEDHLWLIEQALKRSFPNSRTTMFSSGQEALTFFRKKRRLRDAEQIELILLDIDLPDYDSVKLVEYLKRSKLYCNIPVIILSDYERPPAVQKAIDIGAEEHIVKPFDFHDFTDLLHRKLRQWIIP